jgi:hypothetical protein
MRIIVLPAANSGNGLSQQLAQLTGLSSAQLATEAPEPVEREERPDNADKADEAEREEAETNGTSDGVEDNTKEADVRVVELGLIGSASVVVTNEGVTLGEVWLAPGWDAELVELAESPGITVVLTSAKVTLLARINPELEVQLKDITPEPKEEEPEIQTRKEISVGDAGRVVVEREGDKLWLAILSTHEYFDGVIVSSTGTKVHAYFTNDGFEHNVRAWIKGAKIKHETWIVEPKIASYDGTVSCGFGNVGVLVEGNIARVKSVQEVEGIEAVIKIEVGEWVRVKFFVEDEVWVLDAFGNGEEVLRECGQIC